MTDRLREIDEAIARLRGWTNPGGSWFCPASEAQPVHDWWMTNALGDDAYAGWSEHDPPPFSSWWAVAGPLLEEAGLALYAPRPPNVEGWLACWRGVGGCEGCESSEEGATPTEAIARAWLAANGGK